MRIWIINHYALHPSQAGGTRHFSLARELVRRGHDVLIVASSVDYTSRVESKLTRDEAFKEEVLDGVRFLWLKTPVYSGNGIARIRNMLTFAWKVRVLLRTIAVRDPDVIVGSSPHPFSALAAESLSRRLRVPFVLEVRDLWPQSLIDLGRFSPRHPLIVTLTYIERYLYRRAERIVCLLPGAEEYIESAGGDRTRISWIPNGIDLSLAPRASESPRRNAGLRLMYAGAHGVANGLDTLLDALALLRDQGLSDLVNVELVGDGPEKPRLQQRAAGLRLLNITFTHAVPKREIHAKLADADAFLMLLKGSPVFRWGVSPNKLFDYMAAARPVIFGVNTPVNPVDAAGCGVSVPADEPSALADAIRALAALPSGDRDAMGRRGREYVESHHDLSRIAERLEEALHRAVLDWKMRRD